MSDDQIKPCPHCGRKPHIRPLNAYLPSPWIITCKACFPKHRRPFAGETTRAESVATWNRRAHL